jgi:predicted histidine transporter YuiF (NhaC family)
MILQSYSWEKKNLHMSSLATVDYVVLVVYFIIVLMIGLVPTLYSKLYSLYVKRRQRQLLNDEQENRQEEQDEAESSQKEELTFFLAGR